MTAPAGENYDIVRADPTSRVLLQGWLSGEAASKLFAAAGLDLGEQRKAARRADFRPVELKGQAFFADLSVKTVRAESRNVLAKLPGKTHPDEVVMFGAHWDAYGKGAPDSQGRVIRPAPMTTRWASRACWNWRARSRQRRRPTAAWSSRYGPARSAGCWGRRPMR